MATSLRGAAATSEKLGQGNTLIKNKLKTKGAIAVDNGGQFIKVAKDGFVLQKPIPSAKVYGFERTLNDDDPENHDYVVYWEEQEEYYFVGNLAIREGEGVATRLKGFTESKSTDYFILSTLLAVALYGYDENYVVTDVPINCHTDDEKQAVKNRLINNGEPHKLHINGEEKTFTIADAIVMAECINAFWVLEPAGKTRWLDIGSRTVNFGTMLVEDDKVYPIAAESDTSPIGLEKVKNKTPKAYAKSLQGELGQKGWSADDEIYIIGGGALNDELVNELQAFYPNAVVPEDPQNIQVKGMLAFGQFHWEDELPQS